MIYVDGIVPPIFSLSFLGWVIPYKAWEGHSGQMLGLQTMPCYRYGDLRSGMGLGAGMVARARRGQMLGTLAADLSAVE